MDVQHLESELAARKQALEARINQACQRAGRSRDDVKMIAVTKYSSLEATEEIFRLGVRELGESRWQEARSKWERIGADAAWHFIGHLQTNKVKDILGKFNYIHSLDRLNLAEELERKASALQLDVQCLVQLNISGEQTKYGLEPGELESFLREMSRFPHLRIEGLMTMAPYDAPEPQIRSIFRRLRELRGRAVELGWTSQSLRHLSMGMSDDFEVAVEEGATMVRLGSALMGERER